MLIDGGGNDNKYTENIYEFIENKHELFWLNIRIPVPQDNFVTLTSMFAVSSGSIGVDLQTIPNEPIRFTVRLILLFCSNLYQ